MCLARVVPTIWDAGTAENRIVNFYLGLEKNKKKKNTTAQLFCLFKYPNCNFSAFFFLVFFSSCFVNPNIQINNSSAYDRPNIVISD